MIRLAVRTDSGRRAYAHRPPRPGEEEGLDHLARVALTWVCADQRSADVMDAVLAGRFGASPRARCAVRLTGQPSLSFFGDVPLTLTTRRVPSFAERTAARAEQRPRAAVLQERLVAIG